MSTTPHDIPPLLQEIKTGKWVFGAASTHSDIAHALTAAADKCHFLNTLPPSQRDIRQKIIKEIVGSIGTGFTIHSPFRCDLGFNIHIGQNFMANFNLTILDEAEVSIGDNVMIGPNCTIITITHALNPDQRNRGLMQAKPVSIGNNVWIASGVTILPGVTIGDNTVVGAGSIVAKDLPPNVLSMGSPCRATRPITQDDIISMP